MSELTYRWARRFCCPVFWISSRGVVLHADRAALTGGYILASNHQSFTDAALLIGHTPRQIDFIGAAELARGPVMRGFLSLFNVIYLNRKRRDMSAVLAAVRRLRAGRVVGIFPEGGIRTGSDSVVNGGAIDPGIARLAMMADVPVVPCVVLGGENYHHIRSWLPHRSTRYGVIFGNPLRPNTDGTFLQELQNAYHDLGRELMRAMDCPGSAVPA